MRTKDTGGTTEAVAPLPDPEPTAASGKAPPARVEHFTPAERAAHGKATRCGGPPRHPRRMGAVARPHGPDRHPRGAGSDTGA